VAATAVHLGFAKIHGWFRDFSGTLTVADRLEHSSVDVVIDATSIDTGNADRDAHLRSPEFLDVAAFPQIRYTGQRLTVVRPDTWRTRRPAHPEVRHPTCRAEHQLSGYRCRSAGRRPRRVPCQHRTRPRSVRH
jgi:YceI-like domain